MKDQFNQFDTRPLDFMFFNFLWKLIVFAIFFGGFSYAGFLIGGVIGAIIGFCVMTFCWFIGFMAK